MVDELIEAQEDTVLASVPDKMKPAIKEKFTIQTKEIYNILDEANEIKNDETNKIYNNCFLITAIFAALGLIAVPFNKKNETELNKAKA